MENEPVLAQMADHPTLYDPQQVIAFVDQGVSLLSSQLQYTMGGHREFTFAAEGKESLFYLLPYLVSRKPGALDSWTFRPLLPGQGSTPFDFSMFDLCFSSGEVLIDIGLEPSTSTFLLPSPAVFFGTAQQPDSFLPAAGSDPGGKHEPYLYFRSTAPFPTGRGNVPPHRFEKSAAGGYGSLGPAPDPASG